MRPSRLAIPPVAFVLLLLCGCPKPTEPTPTPDDSAYLWEIARLEWQRPDAPEPLTPFVSDGRPAVRARAALALGRLGEAAGAHAADAFVTQLETLLGDSDPTVRAAAAWSAGLIGEPAAGLLTTDAALAEPDATVRKAATRAMAWIVPTNADAAKDSAERKLLETRLSEPDLAGVAALALGVYAWRARRAEQTPHASPEAVEQLIDGFQKSDHRYESGYALFRLGPPQARTAYLTSATDPDPRIRALTMQGIGALRSKEVPLDVLQKGADDPDPTVAAFAVEALGQRAHTYHQVLPTLHRVITSEDGDSDRRVVTRVALEQLATLSHASNKKVLRDRLDPKDAALFSAAANAWIASAGDAGVDVLAPLATEDAPWDVRFAVARSLAWAASRDLSKSRRARKLTGTLMADPDGRVRAAATSSYAALNGPHSVKKLTEVLQTDADVGVVITSARLLAQWEHAPAADVVAKRLREGGVETPEGKVALLQVLNMLAPGKHTDVVTPLASDASPLVARTACEILGEHCPPRPAVLPDALPQDRDAFAAIASLKHATIRTTRGDIEAELLGSDAPAAVYNFATLARRGFYKDVRVQESIPGFIVQTGGRRGDGFGSPGYTIPCELSAVAFEPGTIGMTLNGRDTGGAQFFFATDRLPHVDGHYTAFARVTKGLDVVTQLEPGDRILSISIDES